MIRYVTLEQVYRLQERALADRGGMPGVRDAGAIESAVAQPQMTFGGEDLYPTLAEKAAALGFSLIKNPMPLRTPTSVSVMRQWKPSCC